VTGETDPVQPSTDAQPPPPAELRQRWRITFARDPVDADQAGRAVLDAWQECLAGSGLPVAGLEPGGAGKGRIAFAAPLPAAARGDAELADVWLLERCPLWAIREALADRLPGGHRWVGAEDVWLGAPALAGRVVAADWRVELVGPAVDGDRLAGAARQLIGARSLPRVRVKGGSDRPYDLRLLLAALDVEGADSAGRCGLAIRTRLHPELGSGRPEEVVAALAEELGVPLEIGAIRRIRLLLDEELPARSATRTRSPISSGR
jgi:hypothetical protein